MHGHIWVKRILIIGYTQSIEIIQSNRPLDPGNEFVMKH